MLKSFDFLAPMAPEKPVCRGGKNPTFGAIYFKVKGWLVVFDFQK